MAIKNFSDILTSLLSGRSSSCTNLSAKEFQRILATLPVVLLDVRTGEEYAQGRIAQARNEDYYDSAFLQNVQNSVGTDSPLAIYCRSGRRSEGAARLLCAAGYRVYNLEGGILEWEREGLPIER